MRAKKLKLIPPAERQRLQQSPSKTTFTNYHTVLGRVECLDESMTPRDLLECFDQLSFRREAAQHAIMMDDGVRRYFADLLRARLPRR
jgi:hypothetical protein